MIGRAQAKHASLSPSYTRDCGRQDVTVHLSLPAHHRYIFPSIAAADRIIKPLPPSPVHQLTSPSTACSDRQRIRHRNSNTCSPRARILLPPYPHPHPPNPCVLLATRPPPVPLPPPHSLAHPCRNLLEVTSAARGDTWGLTKVHPGTGHHHLHGSTASSIGAAVRATNANPPTSPSPVQSTARRRLVAHFSLDGHAGGCQCRCQLHVTAAARPSSSPSAAHLAPDLAWAAQRPSPPSPAEHGFHCRHAAPDAELESPHRRPDKSLVQR